MIKQCWIASARCEPLCKPAILAMAFRYFEMTEDRAEELFGRYEPDTAPISTLNGRIRGYLIWLTIEQDVPTGNSDPIGTVYAKLVGPDSIAVSNYRLAKNRPAEFMQTAARFTPPTLTKEPR